MIILIAFAFLAGVVTILSPCILPILPIVLSSTVDDSGKRRPLGVVVGFVLSFTFFTLFLSSIVRLTGIPAETLRYVSIVILILFGLTLLLPRVQFFIEQQFTKLAQLAPNRQTKHGFTGGVIIGLSLGLLWTPCVGPILASVISLALTGTVTAEALFITLSYSIGTAIPMFIIMMTGSTALKKVPWLLRNTGRIQKGFGVLMIITAIGIFFNVDRQFQNYVLNTFPQYGVGLTSLEDNEAVKQQLDNLNQRPMDSSQRGKPMSELTLQKGPQAPELVPGGEWFNTEPVTLAQLEQQDKVVLIDFWTYSCINCQRTLPYLRKWWESYKDDGFVIIGVHSPEFEFEKDPENVQEAINDFALTYPVMQDNNFSTWRAYNNRYWPAKYLIDKDGIIRYTHFGEGAYDETEEMIQKLLEEAGGKEVSRTINNPTYENYSRTHETYLGYGRISNFASSERLIPDTISSYSAPENLPPDGVAYEGEWNVMREYANPQKGAVLLLNFEAKEVFLVMRSKDEEPSRVRVSLNDDPQAPGEDVVESVVTVTADTLYKLINLSAPGRHILRLEFEDDNTEVYAFTFG